MGCRRSHDHVPAHDRQTYQRNHWRIHHGLQFCTHHAPATTTAQNTASDRASSISAITWRMVWPPACVPHRATAAVTVPPISSPLIPVPLPRHIPVHAVWFVARYSLAASSFCCHFCTPHLGHLIGIPLPLRGHLAPQLRHGPSSVCCLATVCVVIVIKCAGLRTSPSYHARRSLVRSVGTAEIRRKAVLLPQPLPAQRIRDHPLGYRQGDRSPLIRQSRASPPQTMPR